MGRRYQTVALACAAAAIGLLALVWWSNPKVLREARPPSSADSPASSQGTSPGPSRLSPGPVDGIGGARQASGSHGNPRGKGAERVRCVDLEGRPLAGVEVSAHREVSADWQGLRRGPSWRALLALGEGRTGTPWEAAPAISDADGWVVLPPLPAGNGGEGQAAGWCFTAPGRKTHWLCARGERSETVALREAESIRAQSSRPGASEVRAVYLGPVAEGAPGVAEPPIQRRRTGPGPWEFAAAEGEWIAVALAPSERSLPATGPARGMVVFEFGEHFALSGAVAFSGAPAGSAAGADFLGESHVAVRAFLPQAEKSRLLAQLPVSPDGAFGPESIPWLGPLWTYGLVLHGPGHGPLEKTVQVPGPGGQVAVHFTRAPSVRARIAVFAAHTSGGARAQVADLGPGRTEPRGPLRGAQLELHYESDGGPQMAVAESGPDGTAWLWLPAGAFSQLSVSHPGFAPASLELPALEASAGAAEFSVVLERALTGKLRVLRDGAWLPSFTLHWEDREGSGTSERTAGADGFALLPEVAPGPLRLLAAHGGRFTRERVLQVEPGDTVELELQLEAPAFVLGRVVDALSAKPLAGVQLWAAFGERELGPREFFAPAAPTGSDGAFVLGPLPPGPRRIYAYRDGYAPGEREWDVGRGLDPLLLFPLHALVPTTVRVHTDRAALLEGLWVHSAQAGSEAVPVGPKGLVRLMVPRGLASIALTTSTGEQRVQTIQADGSDRPMVEFHLPAETELRARFESPVGEAWTEPAEWVFSYTAPSGAEELMGFSARLDQEYATIGLAAPSAHLRISHPDGGLLFDGTVDTTPKGGFQRLHLGATEGALELRFRDGAGRPYPGVAFYFAGDSAGHGQGLRSDKRGVVRLFGQRGLAGDGAVLAADASLRGVVDWTSEDSADGVVECVLEPHLQRVALWDRGEALVPREIWISDLLGRLSLARVEPLEDGGFGVRGLLPGRYRAVNGDPEIWMEPVPFSTGERLDLHARRRTELWVSVVGADPNLPPAKLELTAMDQAYGGTARVGDWMRAGWVASTSLEVDSRGELRVFGLPRGRYLAVVHQGSSAHSLQLTLEEAPDQPVRIGFY